MLRAACLMAMLLASCASQRVVDRFAEITPGMGRDEVIAILGEPSSRWALSRTIDGVDGERLQWGDGLSSLASSAVYRGKPDRAYCVDFDLSGKVIETAAPTWVEEAGVEEAGVEEAGLEDTGVERTASGEPRGTRTAP